MEIDAILKLIETDEKVRSQVQEVHDKKNQLKQRIEDEKKKISEDTWKEVYAKVDQTKKALDEKIKTDDLENQAYYERVSALLQEQYSQNKDKWRKEIYQRVICDTETEV